MNTDVGGWRGTLRTVLLVCLVAIILALGALELAASRLATEELDGREKSVPAPTWLAH
jgi:hypothetical protein